eukprot:403345742
MSSVLLRGQRKQQKLWLKENLTPEIVKKKTSLNNGRELNQKRVELGKGGFGHVTQQTIQINGIDQEIVAVKRINIDEAKLTELEVMIQIKSPFLNPMKDYYVEEENSSNLKMQLCIIQPLAKCNLLEFRQNYYKYEPIPESVILEIFAQVSIAVRALHDHAVIHKDITPTNVLVFIKESGNYLIKFSNFTFKLSDFGLAEIFKQGCDVSFAYVGKLKYLAPEVLDVNNSKGHSYPSDIYSLGQTMINMMKQENQNSNEMGNSMEETLLDISKIYSKDIVDLLGLMCHEDPEKRPTIYEILSYPFLRLTITCLIQEISMIEQDRDSTTKIKAIIHDSQKLQTQIKEMFRKYPQERIDTLFMQQPLKYSIEQIAERFYDSKRLDKLLRKSKKKNDKNWNYVTQLQKELGQPDINLHLQHIPEAKGQNIADSKEKDALLQSIANNYKFNQLTLFCRNIINLQYK